MNFDDFKYNDNNVPHEMDKRDMFFEELKKEFVKEMKESKVNKDFFSKYKSTEVDAFILDYSDYKVRLARSYDTYLYEVKYKDLKWKTEAANVFNYIKQKQLFNLQLQWRAEEIKIEGILTCQDFEFWENNINDCYFLPEISDYEVKLLKDYLLSVDYTPEAPFSFFSWQDYDMFFTSNFLNFNNEYPNWYQFYDERLGTGKFTQLPNIRGHKERHYIAAKFIKEHHLANLKKQKQLNDPNYVEPPPPLKRLHWADPVIIEEFVNLFESDPHIVELFRIQRKQHKNYSSRFNSDYKKHEIFNENDITDDVVKEIIDKLDDIEEPVAMPDEFEWREAIIKCYDSFYSKKIESFIDTIYEEYQMYKDIGIKGSKTKEQLLKELAKDKYVSKQRKIILKGRKYLNEPLDFNF